MLTLAALKPVVQTLRVSVNVMQQRLLTL